MKDTLFDILAVVIAIILLGALLGVLAIGLFNVLDIRRKDNPKPAYSYAVITRYDGEQIFGITDYTIDANTGMITLTADDGVLFTVSLDKCILTTEEG